MFHQDLAKGGSRARAWFDSIVYDHAFLRAGWSNFAEVIPGKLYRSNHPTPSRLIRTVRLYEIRTIVNLRGQRPCGSDQLSRAAARDLGVTQIDMPFESRGAPHRDRILRFAAHYRSMTFPALMHCKSGADRAGLAAGLAVLFEGGTAKQAMRQLSLRYGHFSRSSTGILDAFFRLYAEQAEGRLLFLDWVEHEYDETALRAAFRAHGLSNFLNDRVLRRE